MLLFFYLSPVEQENSVARLLLLLFTLCLSSVLGAVESVNGVRSWSDDTRTRLVLDLSGQVEHSLFELQGPDRIVVDLKNAQLKQVELPDLSQNRFIQAMRSGVRNGNDLRVVIDLKEQVTANSFQLDPSDNAGHRLVIDISTKSQVPEQASTAAVSPTAASVATRQLPVSTQPGRDLVIAIDAGHGGRDPGAIGKGGTREKDVVLAIAKELQKLINAEPGMRAVMVRDGDYFIPLRRRMEIARKEKADFFVSVHADAFHDIRAKGSSVFVLSKSGATSEAAKWLADRENAADLVGGVSLGNKDEVLASVLLDLSQSATMQMSHDVAAKTIDNLARLGPIHGKKEVQKARFMVLNSPDIPSMLVESAFISNPDEEKKLRSADFQKKVAQAILGGVRSYFHESPPPDSWLAQNRAPEHADQHVIAPGDTLSEIAVRYSVSLSRLRDANRINDDKIRVGQVLMIPQ
jgi:N-acetylmuramoyl-L-alanine amidase